MIGFLRGLVPLFLFVLLASCSLKDKEDASQYITHGNMLYEAGNYTEAVSKYWKALNQGYNNGHVYYNLANAYYRLGHYGSAIAAYRRALKQLPRDPDILANLELARDLAQDKIEKDKTRNLEFRKLCQFRARLNEYELQLLSLLFYIALWVSLAVYLYRRDAFSLTALFASCCGLLLWSFMLFGMRPGRLAKYKIAILPSQHEIHPAVITAPLVEVRSGNSETFQVVFLLHDGAEIEVRSRRGQWVQIQLPQGRKGWVTKSNLEIL